MGQSIPSTHSFVVASSHTPVAYNQMIDISSMFFVSYHLRFSNGKQNTCNHGWAWESRCIETSSWWWSIRIPRHRSLLSVASQIVHYTCLWSHWVFLGSALGLFLEVSGHHIYRDSWKGNLMTRMHGWYILTGLRALREVENFFQKLPGLTNHPSHYFSLLVIHDEGVTLWHI